MLFAKEDMAKYICRRIYRWFVFYYIDETVEKNIITPLAAIFKNNNFEIWNFKITSPKKKHPDQKDDRNFLIQSHEFVHIFSL